MGPTDAPSRLRRVPAGALLLVAVAYVPLLLTKPGRIGADTKSYLYLDPGRLLSRAPYMWDTNIGLGTITHQNIGYLWPMGPYYWLLETLGVPDWVAQRLWLGSIICAAGLGMRWMLKELDWRGTGVTVASFAYALSPYLLDYASRISVILLPFAGLPWLVGLAARSVRRGGWRSPAAFALVTLTVGGVNATSLLLVMVAPILWMAHATFVAKEATWRRTLAAGTRIAVLTLATSLWWMVGLGVQGTYGIPILRYTETYFVVANAALAPELLRGLGYWFFYGRDALGAWIAPAVTMVQNVPALALSYLLPLLAFTAGLLSRFRHRGYFALLVLVGLLMGVGSHPWESSTPAGAAFKAWTRTDSGLAFRSTPRAVPLIALGLAVMLGAGVAAVSRWRPGWHLPVAAALLVLVCANQLALFRGQMVDRNLLRDSEVPTYWTEAARSLDRGDPRYRVAEVPGTDFASYRWGNTVDPITPGLMDRDYVARELIPYGTPASANLLNDWDLPLQQGTSDPSTFAPLARLLGVGDVVHRADLAYERFRTPRPRLTYAELLGAPGLGTPTGFGPATPNVPDRRLPLQDEVEFGTPDSADDPPPVSVFPVEDPRPVLRTVQASDPVVLAGNGAGIVALAASGGLQVDRPLLYSATLSTDATVRRQTLGEAGTSLVVTDTNRRQARRWGSVRENDGVTEQAGQTALVTDYSDNRLDVFPGAGDDSATVVELQGPVDARSSAYGNPVSYTASDRAANAVDGDPTTAWRVGAFQDVQDEFLELRLREPVTTDRLTLLQSQRLGNRWITEARLTFGNGGIDPERDPSVTERLTDTSRTPPGQELRFPTRTFDRLRITVTGTNLEGLARWTGISDVGIAEVTIPGVGPTTEIVRPPVDLLRDAGDGSIARSLSYVFTRRSADPSEVVVEDEERRLLRWVEGPVARAFTPFGKLRLSAAVPGEVTDRLIGQPSAEQGGLTATADATLAGDLRSRPSVAVDGDPATAWRTPVNGVVGNWVEVRYPGPVTVDRLPVTLVTDGRHSVPTRLRMVVDGRDGPVLELGRPELGRGRERGATTTVDADTGGITGTTFRFVIDAAEEVPSTDWFGGARTVTPAGIAELGLPTRSQPSAETLFPADCRSDLLTLGDRPVPVRAVGTVGDALARQPLRFESCDGPEGVPAGRTLLTTTPGRQTGLDVDLVTLASAPGGGPGVDTLATPPGPGPTPPATRTDRPGRLTYTATVDGARDPYWVVLGQSLSPGWTARAGDVDLGPPTLVNGFANGWRVDPAKVGTDATITLEWTPQRAVWIALWASLAGVLLCVGLCIRPPRLLGGGPVDPSVVAPMDVRGTGPLDTDGGALGPASAALGGVAVALVGWVFLGPWAGLAAGLVAVAALGLRRGQVLLRTVGVGVLALSFAFIVAKQARNGFVVDFDWMNKFEVTHAPVLLATALLALDPLVEVLRRRAGRTTAATEDGTPRGITDEPGG